MSISSRFDRHRSSPVRASSAATNDWPPMWSQVTTRVSPCRGRRRALAERVAHEAGAEVGLPLQLAVEVVGVQPPRAEERVEPLAVGDRRPGGVGAVRQLVRLVRHRLAGDPPPRDGAGLAVERHDDELVPADLLRTPAASTLAGASPVATAPAGATGARARLRRSPPRRRCGHRRGVADGYGGQQEHPVAPHDGRRRAAPGDLDLPGDVLGLAPRERRFGMPGDSGRLGSAPLAPVAVGPGGLGVRRRGPSDHQPQNRRRPGPSMHGASSPDSRFRRPRRAVVPFRFAALSRRAAVPFRLGAL